MNKALEIAVTENQVVIMNACIKLMNLNEGRIDDIVKPILDSSENLALVFGESLDLKKEFTNETKI